MRLDYRTKEDGGKKKVTIRNATKSDIPTLIENMQRAAGEMTRIKPGVIEEHKRRLDMIIEDNGRKVLCAVAELGGKLVGSLTLERDMDVKNSDHVRHLDMLVIQEQRRIGIGTALMDYAIKWSTDNKYVEKITLEVYSNNQAAIGLCKKFGFEVEGIRKKQFIISPGRYADEFDMGLFIK